MARTHLALLSVISLSAYFCHLCLERHKVIQSLLSNPMPTVLPEVSWSFSNGSAGQVWLLWAWPHDYELWLLP